MTSLATGASVVAKMGDFRLLAVLSTEAGVVAVLERVVAGASAFFGYNFIF